MFTSNQQWLGFDDRWMMLIGIPLTSLVITILIFTDVVIGGGWDMLSACFVAGLFYTIVYWFSFRYVCIHARKRFPSTQQIRKRIIYQIGIILFTYFIIKVILHTAVDPFLHQFLTKPEHEVGLQMTIASLTISFLVIAIYENIYFHAQLQRSITEKEQLERENIQSQLEGLKNQVNPHFLFNSLNTLSYLIPEDSDRSLRFVQQLSKVYRYILEIRDEKLISVKEELTFIDAYVYLLKERFGQNLEVNIKVPEAHMSDQVVPLSLQMLLENAIKHNIISTEHPLRIDIFVEQGLKLIVKNNLQKKKQEQVSTKVGLQNIKNRYQFFTDKTVDVIVSTSSFIVAIPLLELPD